MLFRCLFLVGLVLVCVFIGSWVSGPSQPQNPLQQNNQAKGLAVPPPDGEFAGQVGYEYPVPTRAPVSYRVVRGKPGELDELDAQRINNALFFARTTLANEVPELVATLEGCSFAAEVGEVPLVYDAQGKRLILSFRVLHDPGAFYFDLPLQLLIAVREAGDDATSLALTRSYIQSARQYCKDHPASDERLNAVWNARLDLIQSRAEPAASSKEIEEKQQAFLARLKELRSKDRSRSPGGQ